MEITRSSFTISELRDMWERKELIINRDYQRSSSIWPESARSFLIDTILTKYIVPKVFFYEIYDKTRKKIIREIVDGQQRINTILSFLKDDFRLNNKSANYRGHNFSSLDDSLQQKILTYVIEVDIIRDAEQSDLLAMFTRMNAYTAPLNPAEKRHAQFEGAFKWFILNLREKYSSNLVNIKVITTKQSIRMVDSEFFTELCIFLKYGIVDKSEKYLNKIYEDFNKEFAEEDDFHRKIKEFMDFISIDLVELHGSFIMKPYILHSLFCAMMQKKYGIPHGQNDTGIVTDGSFYNDIRSTRENLSALAGAHEAQDQEGRFAEYVEACLSTTHRVRQRKTRSKWLGSALT